MHGNMKLIVELFKLDMVKGQIVKTCLDELFQEMSGRNIEVLCGMLDTLSTYQCKMSHKARTEKAEPKAEPLPTVPEKQNNQQRKYQVKGEAARKQYKAKNSVVSLDYLEICLQNMFRERTNTQVESRVRFKIQDLIDKFEKDWKHEIFYHRRNETDSEGFQKKYVPKGSKLAQEANAAAKRSGSRMSGRDRKNSRVSSGKEKKQAAAQPNAKAAAGGPDKKSMYNMLKSLAPDANEESK